MNCRQRRCESDIDPNVLCLKIVFWFEYLNLVRKLDIMYCRHKRCVSDIDPIVLCLTFKNGLDMMWV